MVDYWRIYHAEAERYDRLVSREDQEGNLVAALESICALPGSRVVELGAGTGRITRILSPRVSDILALDISAHMLGCAGKKLIADYEGEGDPQNWHLLAADNRQLPLKTGVADLAIAGWSLGHSVGWYSLTWRQQIALALSEMRRVTLPGGSLVIIETLGTGNEEPEPPNEALAEYYRWLENEYGFTRIWIRTDYRFHSVAEAVELTTFFFGEDLAARIMGSDSCLLPECTGIWFLTTPK